MKILIDIGHPAQVHYFKFFISEMKKRGHEFCIVARDKDVTLELLNNYKIPHITRGKGGNNLVKKFLYLFEGNFKVFRIAIKFKPDLFLSFGSIHAAHIAFLLKKPHIAFDDTERAFKEIWTTFTDIILTPSCYLRKLGHKQIKFNGYMELCHLHPKRFRKDEYIYKLLGIPHGTKYVVLRLVSWEASHDLGQKGISGGNIINLINEIEHHAKVFVSSEGALSSELKQYKLDIPPEKFHDVLASACLYIGEGSTSASECAVLGVPNIYINSITVGYCHEQSMKYKTCIHLKKEDDIIKVTKSILSDEKFQLKFEINHKGMMNDKIDVTAFMVWFIENYPISKRIMMKHPDYQLNFK